MKKNEALAKVISIVLTEFVGVMDKTMERMRKYHATYRSLIR